MLIFVLVTFVKRVIYNRVMIITVQELINKQGVENGKETITT